MSKLLNALEGLYYLKSVTTDIIRDLEDVAYSKEGQSVKGWTILSRKKYVKRGNNEEFHGVQYESECETCGHVQRIAYSRFNDATEIDCEQCLLNEQEGE